MAGDNEESRDRVAAGNYKKLARGQVEVASNIDILNQIFKHLDPASLAMASCVTKKWKQVTDDEGLWEGICTRHWPSTASLQRGQLKSVVVGLGGFRRLYVNCLHPLLSRNKRNHKNSKLCSISKGASSSAPKQKWSEDEVYLSLSLFSIDRYERILPLHLNSARRAGLVWKPCSDEQEAASSSSTAFWTGGEATLSLILLQGRWTLRLKVQTIGGDPWIHNPPPNNRHIQTALKVPDTCYRRLDYLQFCNINVICRLLSKSFNHKDVSEKVSFSRAADICIKFTADENDIS